MKTCKRNWVVYAQFAIKLREKIVNCQLQSLIHFISTWLVKKQKAISWGRGNWEYFPTKMLCIAKMRQHFVGDILNPLYP